VYGLAGLLRSCFVTIWKCHRKK